MAPQYLGQLKWPKWFVKQIQPWIRGRDVWDMGCGPDSHLAKLLLGAGASSVTSVDKEWCFSMKPVGPNHRIRTGVRMEEIYDPIDVALISWPLAPLSTGSMPWFPLTKTIIYAGVNRGGTVCCMPGLFGELAKREVLFHHAGRGERYSRGPTQDIVVAGDRTMDGPYCHREPVTAEVRLLASLIAMQRLDKEIRDDRIQQIDGT